MSASSVFIPISGSADAIRLPLSDLPASGQWDDGFSLAEMLGRELAHPDLWLRIAMAYFESDNLVAFESLLRDFTAEEAQYAYSDERFKAGRIKIFNLLAAYETRKASLASSSLEQEASYHHATDLYNRSADLDPQATLTWVGKAVLMMVKGQIDDAASAFNSALMSDVLKDNVLVRLGLGCILVQKKQYAEAIKHYKAALQSNPLLPGYVRLGFAICYYHLGDMAQCRAAFHRVLDLSPDGENVHALLGLATLELNAWRERANQIEIDMRKGATSSTAQAALLQSQMASLEGDRHISKAFDFLERAFALDPSNPHALLMLSTHAFYTNDLKKSREFANKAVAACNLTPSLATAECKAVALYHVARSCHAQGLHAEAFERYRDAKDLLPNHPPICLGYAQMLLACRGETEQAIENLELVIAGANRAAIGGKDAPSTADAKQMAAAASNNFEVLRLLGSLYAMPPSASAAMTKAASLSGGRSSKSAAAAAAAILSLPDFEKSYLYLKKSVDLQPNSLELLLEFAEVAARLHEYQQSYLSYKRCLKLMTDFYKTPTDDISPEMLNNFGVVCQQMGKFDESREYYEWSLRNRAASSSEATNGTGAPIAADKVTTHYNLGLLQAANGSSDASLATMQTILGQYPNYTDALLYSGMVYQRSGDFPKAKAQFDQAQTIQSSAAAAAAASSDAAAAASVAATLPVIQCALGNWHLDQHEIDGAKSCFDAILMKLGPAASAAAAAATGNTRKDDYAKLSLGNLTMLKIVRKLRAIQLANPGMPVDHPTFQAKMRDAKVDWREVAAFFENVLRADGKNLYAAHGLGCVLAHQGKTLEAKEIFQQVKDTAAANHSADEMHDVWCNLGHVYVQQGSYVSAVKMYQHCLTEFRGSHAGSTVQVMTYLARAYYLSDAFLDAKRTLLSALHLSPTSSTLWYNLGLVSEAYAIDIFQKPPAFRTFREVESAILELNHAFAIFTRLKATPTTRADAQLHGDIAEKTGRHALFCNMSITNGRPHLAFAEQREAEQARLLEESRVAKAKLDAEAEEKSAAAAAAAIAEQQRHEDEARAKKKYLEDISATWETVRSEETVKKERVASNNADDDYTMSSGLDADAELARRREKQKSRASTSGSSKKRSKRADSGSDGEGEEEGDRKRKKKKESKTKGARRSKYHEAEGSDAERDASPPRAKEEEEEETGGVDVEAELASRRAKASHLTDLVSGEPKEKRRLTKATTDSDDEEAEAHHSKLEDEEEDATMDAVDETAVAPQDDDDEEAEYVGQQSRKKTSKKRRQIDDDDDEGEAEADAEVAADEPTVDAAEDATAEPEAAADTEMADA